MRIAIIHHRDSFYSHYSLYIASLIQEMAKATDADVFHYSRAKPAEKILPEKTSVINIYLDANSSWKFYSSYNLQLTGILKKVNPDIIVNLHGIVVKHPAPQLVVAPPFIQSYHKGLQAWQKTAIKQSVQYGAKKVKLVCHTNIAKQFLQEQYKKTHDEISCIPFSAEKIFQPLQWHDKVYIKGRFTENNEYFLAAMPYQNEELFTRLLKAFSVFKKWQQSSMRLVLLPFEDGFSAEMEDKLETYKYKNHITILNNTDEKETADIVATAYAYIAMNDADQDIHAAATALQCGLAVTGAPSALLAEYAGKAAYLSDDNSFEKLGQCLIALYKDEDLRLRLAQAALIQAEKNNRSIIAEKLWKLLTT